MAGNPLVAQGVLNRLVASVTIADAPELNVTPPFLGEGAIDLALEGEASTIIRTLTGTVISPEPVMEVSCTLHLLKTQSFSDLWKKRMESNTVLGNVTVQPDARTLSAFPLLNCAILSVREMPLNGKDAGFVVSIKGYYVINNSLWGV